MITGGTESDAATFAVRPFAAGGIQWVGEPIHQRKEY